MMKASVIAVGMMVSSMTVLAEDGSGNSGKYLPMPPAFSLEADSHKVLSDYPLGVINKMAAYTHHGKAHQTVTLVNGLEGWVYEIHQGGNLREFQQPGGEKTTTMDIHGHPVAMTYTLVFDGSGKVIDVLYRNLQHENADSALLVQREIAGDKPSEKSFPVTR